MAKQNELPHQETTQAANAANPNPNTAPGGHKGDAQSFDHAAGSGGGSPPPTTGFSNPTVEQPPKTPEEIERDAQLKEGRERFEKAWAKNHGWKGEPSVEERAELEQHPYYRDPTPWMNAMKLEEEERAKGKREGDVTTSAKK